VQLFDEIVRDARVPVLVDFWAEWCGPCKIAAPEVRKVATEMAGRALIVKVDTERHPDIAARYNVRGIPNFVVIKSGRQVFQQAGMVPHTEMKRWLDAALAA
jgi:thioredoxin 2